MVVNDNQFTDIETLRAWLNLQPTTVSASDTKLNADLTRLIIAATASFKSLINVSFFLTGTYTETFIGDNRARHYTEARPVASITSLMQGSQLISPASTPYQGFGYTFDQYGVYYPDKFCAYKQYTLVYVGGVTTDSGDAFQAEQAVLSLCNLWWKRRPHADQLAQSLGNQISVKYTESELPPETQLIVKTMKRVA